MKLKINKVKFITSKTGIRHAWYLSIVRMKNENACFWSHHDCTNLSDKDAAKAFEREHFAEVEELVKDKIKRESLILN